MAENNEPGVSGKNDHGKNWINPEKLAEQHEFIQETDVFVGHYREDTDREDEGKLNPDKVLKVLQESPEADISQVEVEVLDGQVFLRGVVESPKEERELRKIVENIPGVTSVESELETKTGESLQKD